MHQELNSAFSQSQFSVHPQNEPTSSKTLLNTSSTPGSDITKRIPQNARTIADASNHRFYLPNEAQGPSEIVPPGVYSRDINQAYNSGSDNPKALPVDSSNNLDSEVRDIQPGMTNPAGDIEMTMANNPGDPTRV
jgi:hypothetical protein